MIERIRIDNYALIDKTEWQPHAKFTVITGETGAGKSILLGAIGMTLGQRADTSVLMDKTRKCVIEITYNITGYALKEWFEENDFDYSDCVDVRREITAEGKSRAFINDTPVNNKALKEFGTYLIDVHSQHQSLLLARPEYQMELLDAFSDDADLLQAYRMQYAERRTLSNELTQLRDEAAQSSQEKEYLEFQLTKLDEARLQEGELADLESELKLLTNAESIKTVYSRLVYDVRDREESVVALLKATKQRVASLNDVVASAKEFEGRLDSTILELKDLSDEAERQSENVDLDERRIEVVNARLSTIYDLQMKYHVEKESELIALRNEIAAKLTTIQTYDERIAQLNKKLRTLETAMRDNANALHKSRQTASAAVGNRMQQLLIELGIRHAQFIIDIQSKDDFMPNGMDDVVFLFAANKNQDPGELAKVASGGEISRVMLSLKYILSKVKQLPVIVFDEIDTGLSGEIAHKMAQMMCEMAQNMQVISISHLPQIAAAANMHFKVYKEDNHERTLSRIRCLDEQERIREIAGMISGTEITSAALDAAKSLLENRLF